MMLLVSSLLTPSRCCCSGEGAGGGVGGGDVQSNAINKVDAGYWRRKRRTEEEGVARWSDGRGNRKVLVVVVVVFPR